MYQREREKEERGEKERKKRRREVAKEYQSHGLNDLILIIIITTNGEKRCDWEKDENLFFSPSENFFFSLSFSLSFFFLSFSLSFFSLYKKRIDHKVRKNSRKETGETFFYLREKNEDDFFFNECFCFSEILDRKKRGREGERKKEKEKRKREKGVGVFS